MKKAYGVDSSTLKWAASPQETLLGILRRGEADAVVLLDQFFLHGEQADDVTCLYTDGDAWKKLTGFDEMIKHMVAASESLIRQNPSLHDALLDAFRESFAYSERNLDEVADVFIKTYGGDREALADLRELPAHGFHVHRHRTPAGAAADGHVRRGRPAAAQRAGRELLRDVESPWVMSASELIHLAADLSHYHTDYLWKMPGSWEGYPYYSSPEFYEDIARMASRGIMDMLFFGDSGGTPEDYGGNHHAAVRYGTKWPRHDMMPMIPCMSRVAEGVGFGITMSTTYHHPFHIARVFNGLDHVTKGRIAWNAVTSRSKNEAANYGYKKMIEHDVRYERAQEHLGVCCALWDSIEPDAIVLDRENCIFGIPEKVHLLNFEGEYYSVRGPLPALPSPQGRPVIIQAGQSGPGMDLAAHYADLQFSTRRTVASMKAHRTELDGRLAKFGRQAARLRHSVVGAHPGRRLRGTGARDGGALSRFNPAGSGTDRAFVDVWNGFLDLRRDMRLADVAAEVKAQNVHWGSFEEILKTTDPILTVEQFGRRFMTERILVAGGTPKQIVDKLEQWHFETGANGGFMLARGFSAPGNLQEFVDLVVPELQRRGPVEEEICGRDAAGKPVLMLGR